MAVRQAASAPRSWPTTLGHSQISVTSRYAHVLSRVMSDTAERIGQALWAVAVAVVDAMGLILSTRVSGESAE
jgi:hypothetical protein